MIRHIPNALTITNLLAGFYAITQQDITIALVCIIVSLVADVFDGASARMLGVTSPIGKELDSLADMVSFVTMPAVITYLHFESTYVLVAAGFLTAMGALRLARFNVSKVEGIDFQGMAVPSSAIGVASIWLVHQIYALPTGIIAGCMIALGILNVSKLRMPSLKHLSSNRKKIILLSCLAGAVVITTFVEWHYSLAVFIIGYVLIGLIYHLTYQAEN